MDIDYKKLISDKIKFGSTTDLSDSELLALLLETIDSNSERPLAKSDAILESTNNDLTPFFSHNKLSSLIKRYNLTQKQAIRTLVVGELLKRIRPEQSKPVAIIKNSQDICSLFEREFTNSNFEEFWVVYLNNGNRVVDRKKCADGNIGSVAVDTKLVIRHALNILATKIILVHNHPSGELTPSDDDILLTKKIESAASLFDIALLDHIIISPQGEYYSFNDVE